MTEFIKVLAVDDSEDDRMLYRRVLQKSTDASYSVSEAADGEMGLRLIQEQEPACVLLDYSLPGRNGLEVLKRIRSKYPFVPVVMLTGQGNENVAVSAIQEGAQNYIAKSTITPETLQRVIRVAMEHCALHRRIHEQRTSLEIFTRALAHDLKEPVRTIRSFLDLIAAHEKLSPRGKGYFDYVEKATDRMTTLIDTVYFYTRLDTTEKGQEKGLCDVEAVLHDVKENIGELIRERGATIGCDPLPQVYANRMQLLQVLQNLVCNAIRHCEEAPVIHICAEEGVKQWMFRISDNGPGIDKDYLDKVFEPFKRLSHHSEQGLGLGLAICKKIVEAHGGKIWYESRPEAGATFLFTLPKHTAPLPDKAHVPLLAAVSSRNVEVSDKRLGTIMLIEDNEADIELTRIMLIEEARLKCHLLVARSAHEALQKLHEQNKAGKPVNLILLDINMPGLDGFELLQRLRGDPELDPIPVVMCTTSNYDKDMERARMLGVAGYMTKPAELGKLRSIIENNAKVQICKDGKGYALINAA